MATAEIFWGKEQEKELKSNLESLLKSYLEDQVLYFLGKL